MWTNFEFFAKIHPINQCEAVLLKKQERYVGILPDNERRTAENDLLTNKMMVTLCIACIDLCWLWESVGDMPRRALFHFSILQQKFGCL